MDVTATQSKGRCFLLTIPHALIVAALSTFTNHSADSYGAYNGKFWIFRFVRDLRPEAPEAPLVPGTCTAVVAVGEAFPIAVGPLRGH